MPYGIFATPTIDQTVVNNNQPDYEVFDKFIGRFLADLTEYLGGGLTPVNTDFSNIVVREVFTDFNLQQEKNKNGTVGVISLRRDTGATLIEDRALNMYNNLPSWGVTYNLYIRLEDEGKNKLRRKRMLDVLTSYIVSSENKYTDTVNNKNLRINMNKNNEISERLETYEEINTTNYLTGVLVTKFVIYQP